MLGETPVIDDDCAKQSLFGLGTRRARHVKYPSYRRACVNTPATVNRRSNTAFFDVAETTGFPFSGETRWWFAPPAHHILCAAIITALAPADTALLFHSVSLIGQAARRAGLSARQHQTGSRHATTRLAAAIALLRPGEAVIRFRPDVSCAE